MSKKDPAQESLARKIWLAGLGAYGRAVTDAAENVAKASAETAKKFEELAQRGADIEAKTSEIMTSKVNLFDRPPLEDRLAAFRTAFGLPSKGAAVEPEKADEEIEDTGDQNEDDEDLGVAALKDKLAKLQRQVDALSAQLDEKDD